MQRRRIVVGSLSSVIWPAIVVLIPAGITFAAARVYAEGAPLPPPDCTSTIVTGCADAGDAGEGVPCTTCGTATCACHRSVGCQDTTQVKDALLCTGVQKCADAVNAQKTCATKKEGDGCQFAEDAPGTCMAQANIPCLPDDGGNVQIGTYLFCVVTEAPSGTSGSLTSSTSGTFTPGPDKVPGSSGADTTTSDDSGCSTTGSTAPLLAVPLGLGLLLALRKRQPTKEPSARKRS